MPTVILSALLIASCVPEITVSDTSTYRGGLEGLADGTTRMVDLTHALSPESPHWPGPGYEPFSYEIFATIPEDGVLSGRFTMAEHTGTDLDAPNHFTEGQIPVDRIPLEQLVVLAAVIDVRDQVQSNPDYLLTSADVVDWESEHGAIAANTLVFMYTGWAARWDDFDSYKNADDGGALHFPGFSPVAAELLVNERDVALFVAA